MYDIVRNKQNMSSLRMTRKSVKNTCQNIIVAKIFSSGKKNKTNLTIVSSALTGNAKTVLASLTSYKRKKWTVGVAKFLECKKTLVKNPSEAQQNLWRETSDWIWIVFLFFVGFFGGGGVGTKGRWEVVQRK